MKKIYLTLLIFLIAHVLVLLNIRFTAWPEMVSFPYFVNNGFTIYRDFVHAYPPLLTLILAGTFKIFGESLIALKIFTWSIILINDVLIFLIVKKLTKSNMSAFLSLGFYVLVQPFLEGNQLWPDLAIVTPLLLSTYFLLGKKYFWAGIAIGIACLVKQTAGLYLIFGLGYLIYKKISHRKIINFLVGPMALGFILLVWLVAQGSLMDFIKWDLVLPFTFWGKFPGYVQMDFNKTQLITVGALLLPLILFIKRIKGQGLILLFLILSFLLIYPRFSFLDFQLALSFIAILYGFIASYVVVGVAILLLLINVRSEFSKETRFWTESDLAFGKLIENKVDKGETLYLMGPASNLYFYSGRLPVKPWLDNFGWYFEAPGVSEDVISKWSQNPPDKIIIEIPSTGNWFDLGVYQPEKIKDWIEENYNRKEELKAGVWLWEKR